MEGGRGGGERGGGRGAHDKGEVVVVGQQHLTATMDDVEAVVVEN